MNKYQKFISDDEEKYDLFFKGYRPNFYFRTDEDIPEDDSLRERIIKVIENVTKSDQ